MLVCLFLASPLSHLALLRLGSITSNQIGSVANPCWDEWPNCHSCWSGRYVYVPAFLRLPLIRNSIPRKGLAEEFHLPIKKGRGLPKHVSSLPGSNQNSCNYCLLHIQSVINKVLPSVLPTILLFYSIPWLCQCLSFTESSHVSLCIYFSPLAMRVWLEERCHFDLKTLYSFSSSMIMT